PDDGRLALIRDPDGRERRGVEPHEGVARGGENGRDDLLGIVLDPARLRERLRQLAVTAPADAQLLVDDEARRPGRALVDREDHATISTTSPSASSCSRPTR